MKTRQHGFPVHVRCDVIIYLPYFGSYVEVYERSISFVGYNK